MAFSIKSPIGTCLKLGVIGEDNDNGPFCHIGGKTALLDSISETKETISEEQPSLMIRDSVISVSASVRTVVDVVEYHDPWLRLYPYKSQEIRQYDIKAQTKNELLRMLNLREEDI